MSTQKKPGRKVAEKTERKVYVTTSPSLIKQAHFNGYNADELLQITDREIHLAVIANTHKLEPLMLAGWMRGLWQIANNSDGPKLSLLAAIAEVKARDKSKLFRALMKAIEDAAKGDERIRLLDTISRIERVAFSATEFYREAWRRYQECQQAQDDDSLIRRIEETETWIRHRSRTEKLRERYAPAISHIRTIQKDADAEAERKERAERDREAEKGGKP